mgnify:CR=1 FL=1
MAPHEPQRHTEVPGTQPDGLVQQHLDGQPGQAYHGDSTANPKDLQRLKDKRSGKDDGFYVEGLDESNAFSFIEVPPSWRPYFAGPTIRCSDLLVHLRLQGWAAGLRVRPQYRRLPMGHALAAHLLIAINVRAIKSALSP